MSSKSSDTPPAAYGFWRWICRVPPIWPALVVALAALIWMLSLPRVMPVQMPPLPQDRQAVNNYYRLAFLPDGYPGKLEEDGVLRPHPLYGTFAIRDYLAQYGKTGDTRFLDGARTVADAAIARMDDVHGALVFHYTPETVRTTMPETFYSGLTQARYLEMLSMLRDATADDKYAVAAERVLKSLEIPVEEGGVARRFRDGLVIEEYPNRAQGDYTLNGWTTALRLLKAYADRTGSVEGAKLFERNIAPLKALLPLYDLPELANTRYRLIGPTSARLAFEGTDALLKGGFMDLQAEGQVAIERGTDNMWRNHVMQETSREIVLNAVFSYTTFPAENTLKLDLEAEQAGNLGVEILTGNDDPATGGIDNQHWVRIGSQPLQAGLNSVSVAVPWNVASFAISATNFGRVIGGKRYNSYHFIHIGNLDDLARLAGEPMFAEYSRRWAGYVERWPDMPLYRDAGVELKRYGAK
jgi:D-glucuronyl C5-epimerase C-terminus